MIGFVGLGNMGFPMARRLLEAGYEVAAFDVRSEAMAELARYGAKPTSSPLDVAHQANVVMVSLPTPEVVRQVALGDQGLIYGSRIRTYIDLSTTGPKAAQDIARPFLDKGIRVLDAPVSGGVPGAEKGTLSLMVAGNADVLDQCRPLLGVIGKNIFHVGDQVGQGQMVKVLNNLLSGTAMAATAEVLVLGVKAGLDPSTMLEVFNVSTGRNSATQDKYPAKVANRNYIYGFKTGLLYKDLKMCLDEAERLGVPMWVGTSVRQLWQYAMSQGGPDEDYTEILKHLEKWAAVTVGHEEGKGQDVS